MLELMFDGKEFRLSDGRPVDLKAAGFFGTSVDVVHEAEGCVSFVSKYAGEVKQFNSEFELELWRNSCKPSGLCELDSSELSLVINGGKVKFHVTRCSTSINYTNVSTIGSNKLKVPMSSTTEIEFVVPIYKEKQ